MANCITLKENGGNTLPLVSVPAASSCVEVTAAQLICNETLICSDTVPAGQIISLSPPAGMLVKQGSSIAATVSSGFCPLEDVLVGEYEDCNGPSVDGFTCEEIFECNDTLAEGEAVAQSPIPGDMAAIGSVITITISLGPCPIVLPSYASCAEAIADGFICNEFLECGDTVLTGRIISQSPAAGTEALFNSEISITTSNGPCTAQVGGFSTCDAVLAAGFGCYTEYRCSDTIPIGTVLSQIPPVGSPIAPGSTVTLEIVTRVCTIPMFDMTNINCQTVIALYGFPCTELVQCSAIGTPSDPNVVTPNGTVLGQWPPVGTPISVSPATPTTITRTSGPCPVGDLISPPCFGTGAEAMPADTIPFINAAIAKWNTVLGGELDVVLWNGVPFTGIEICFECAFNLPNDNLAVAGPHSFRSNGLPVAGTVRLNCNRLNEFRADGRLSMIFVHEIAHVLGMGLSPAWNQFMVNTGTSAAAFCGPLAVAEYNAIKPGANVTCVPTDDVGGHWSEITSEGMKNELLSPIRSGSNALSRVSIAAFADIGYEVNILACPPYSWNQD